MAGYSGKFSSNQIPRKGLPFVFVVLSYFLIELFSFFYLQPLNDFASAMLWPLAFGGLWAVLLGCVVRMLPTKAGRIVYGIVYFPSLIYSAVQTGYYHLFTEMLWLSEFLYASEGADYFGILLSYPISWYVCLVLLAALGALIVWKFPRWKRNRGITAVAAVVAAVCAVSTFWMPELVFVADGKIRYSGSDYGRAQSAEAAYDNMFNVHRLYQVCGLYQTAAKDIYTNAVYPLTPGYTAAQAEAKKTIEDYFGERQQKTANEMTGVFQGKNVILVLMESMDDWMLGKHTPTINRLMSEGINFTNFYTPVYGGIRTFNTEFCINTGSFLSSQGGYAFDYVTNHYNQSLASLLTEQGYSCKTFHYNDPSFYSRGVFSPAMGYDEYVCYDDFVEETDEKKRKDLLYDDQLLLDNPGLRSEFFRQEQKMLNFVITRSAHLSYKYNEVLSYWGLKKYPQFRGMTDHEEEDCAYLKAKLVDDFFARMLQELKVQGQLDNTVIIGVTDHYSYGVKDEQLVLERSGVTDALLLEKTPCFIWSEDLQSRKVEKVLNTSDLLPTILNLMGVESTYAYIGQDAFDDGYVGFVPFPDGSWISSMEAYNAGTKEYLELSKTETTEAFRMEMAAKTAQFTRINNLILETDYYK